MSVLLELQSSLCLDCHFPQDSLGLHRKQVPGWIDCSGSGCCSRYPVDSEHHPRLLVAGCTSFLLFPGGMELSEADCCLGVVCLSSPYVRCLCLRLCWEGVLERAGCMPCMKQGYSQSVGAVECFRTYTTAIYFYFAAYLTCCGLCGASDLVNTRDLLLCFVCQAAMAWMRARAYAVVSGNNVL